MNMLRVLILDGKLKIGQAPRLFRPGAIAFKIVRGGGNYYRERIDGDDRKDLISAFSLFQGDFFRSEWLPKPGNRSNVARNASGSTFGAFDCAIVVMWCASPAVSFISRCGTGEMMKLMEKVNYGVGKHDKSMESR
jgi:hypothetical protein